MLINGVKKVFFAVTGVEAHRLLIRKENVIKGIKAFFQFRQWPMFNWVQIETSTFCNRNCHGCPVSLFPRKKAFMSDEVFGKVIDDLARLNFAGIIHLHAFNEPLADKTIVEKVRLISKRLPKAQIKMNSNGDFLSFDMLSQLVSAGLKELYVTQYDGRISQRLLRILDKAGSREKEVLKVRVKSDLDFVGNRAGLLAPEIGCCEPLLADCNRPSNQLVINYRGDIVICCNDYLAKISLGNVMGSSLLEIWNSKKFKLIRRLLRLKMRGRIELCRRCNFYGDIYSCRDLTEEEIKCFNFNVRLRKRTNRITPQRLANALDILRGHDWIR